MATLLKDAPQSLPEPARIDEVQGVTPAQFRAEIEGHDRPVVMRGLVVDWPVVAAGRRSPDALVGYIARFDRGRPVGAMSAPPRVAGRFFYSDDLAGFNFQRSQVKITGALEYLLSVLDETEPPAFAIQSAQVFSNLPGFERDNPLPLVDPEVEPRVWIGNRVVVAAHHDPQENIACVVAGRRRFTLFPPDQIANLYMGPFERTPAGTTISMVDFDAPDPERHPRFAEAMAHAQAADLEPGDALYIPYMWWHQVRSLDRFNMLVNYWWSPRGVDAGHPMDAFLHAMLTIKDLPPAHREAWRAHFNHYVFGANGDPGAHLPEAHRGVLAPLDAPRAKQLRDAVAKGLHRGS